MIASIAYIGPGLGGGIAAAIIGVILSIFLALFAVIWYPLKRLYRSLTEKSNPNAQSSGDDNA